MRKAMFVAARKAVFVGLLFTLSASPTVLPVFVHAAQAITQSQANQIWSGMTQARVKRLLGQPKFTNTYNGVTMWTYPLPTGFFGVHFRNGKVIKTGKLDG
jgi:outer membrane protein assembly factor BamE (lipoprotein component of BamABCDE complex)